MQFVVFDMFDVSFAHPHISRMQDIISGECICGLID